ncbi:MAG: DUF308 domain-containing protein [Xanthobacteraceae bacterium]
MIDSALKQRLAGELHRHWWLFLIRGLLGLGLGVIALVYPGATLAAVVILIGAYLIFDGIIAIAKAIQILRTDSQWWVLLLEVVLGAAVRYECNGEPTGTFKCRCRDCRRLSGRAFSAVVCVSAKGFKVTKGTLCNYSTESTAGGNNKRGFYGKCGSRISCPPCQDGMVPAARKT